MTKCLSEIELEHVVLDVLADPSIPLPGHISSCGLCASVYRDFTNFYTQTDSEFRQIHKSSRTDIVFQKLQQSPRSTYNFDSLHLVKTSSANPLYTRTLAADSPVPEVSKSIHSVGVFTSLDEKLMVRILEGPEESYSLFLLSDSKNLYSNVLVRIVGFDFDYISDKNGLIKLGKIDLPELDNLGIEVRTATEVYDLRNCFPGTNSLVGEKEISVEHSENRRFKMEIFSDNEKFSLKVSIVESGDLDGQDHIKIMVVKSDVQPEVQNFVQGVAIFEDILDPADLRIKIFA